MEILVPSIKKKKKKKTMKRELTEAAVNVVDVSLAKRYSVFLVLSRNRIEDSCAEYIDNAT